MKENTNPGSASQGSQTSQSSHWERQTIQKILMEHIYEQRRSRRWGIFFKICVLVIVLGFLYALLSSELPQPSLTSTPHTAFIDIYGEINGSEGQSNLADDVRSSLKSAFENKQAKGIILRINSPGGSPVPARAIYNDIFAFRDKYPNKKVYAVIEDMGTSAAYLIASAADAIYADQTSLVGSIGVKIDSFGFVDAMKKFGVERRLYIAGKYKGALDPFLPRNPVEDAFVDRQLQLVHESFIDNVKQGRGDRLKVNENPDLFTGQFWVGDDALNLGLIDGFGDAYYVAAEIVKAPEMVDYTPTTTILDRLANRLGASFGTALGLTIRKVGLN